MSKIKKHPLMMIEGAFLVLLGNSEDVMREDHADQIKKPNDKAKTWN